MAAAAAAALAAGVSFLGATRGDSPGARGAPTMVLRGQVLPGIARLPSTGSPPPQERITIAVGLRDRDPAAETRLLHAVYDSRSPLYHQFVRPADFAARFGPAADQYRALTDWLHGGGLAITGTSVARDVVWASGTTGQLDHLFATRIESFHAGGRDFFANVSPPVVPSDLDILGVVGLNSWQRFSLPAAVNGNPVVGRNLTPQDLWGVYHQPAQNTGQGQTMAIFGAGRSDAAVNNLRAFEKNYRLPQTPVRTIYSGSGPFDDIPSDDLEWNLDTQASTGMAPNVWREDLYFSPSLEDADVLASFNRWVDDNVDPQASASFGECEESPADPVGEATGLTGNSMEAIGEQILTRANLQGQTLFSSTGDTGAFCPTINYPVNPNGLLYTGDPRLNYPAASPHAVAVGGTSVYTDSTNEAQRNQEIAWTHTGGGNSLFLKAGDYQVTTRIECLVDPSGGISSTGQPCRGTPDVAAMSGDAADGFQICQPDCTTGAIGTSLSSPLWLGMWTRIQAAAPDQAHRNGFANYDLYKAGIYDAAGWYDVTVGFNGLYTALPGWDNVSGWGAPDVTNLMDYLDGRVTPVNDVYPSPPPVTKRPGALNLALPSACGPLWANAPHKVVDAAGKEQAQLELLSGSMQISSDDKTLKVLLQLAQTPSAASVVGGGQFATGSDADIWLASWQYGGQGYFASAQLDATGAVQYRDGVVASTPTGGPSYTPNYTDDGGALDGTGGALEIDVPLDHVGDPAVGDVLGAPSGASFSGVISPNAVAGGGVETSADSGGPRYNYVLGQQCAAGSMTALPALGALPYVVPALANGTGAAQPAAAPVATPRGPVKKRSRTFDPNGVAVHLLVDGRLGAPIPPLPGWPLLWLAGAGCLAAAWHVLRNRPGRR